MEPYQTLEIEFGKWAGVSNVVACSSGTSALQLAIEALCLTKGSFVIIPEFTMIACARAVTMAGLIPLPIDCDPVTLNLDINKLNALVNPKIDNVSAIMLVHIYGRRSDPCLDQWAARNNLPVIEDLSEAHGVPPGPRTAAACWSFYKNKIIAGEEGGAVAFRNSHVADTAKMQRSLGFTPSHNFDHIPGGFNARMSNCHAQLILESLAKANENIAARKRVVEVYDEQIPVLCKRPPRHANWVYDLTLPNEFPHESARNVVERLNRKGVAARMAFRPVSSQQEYYRDGFENLEAWKASQRVIYLPIRPDMLDSEVRNNVSVLRSVLSYTS